MKTKGRSFKCRKDQRRKEGSEQRGMEKGCREVEGRTQERMYGGIMTKGNVSYYRTKARKKD